MLRGTVFQSPGPAAGRCLSALLLGVSACGGPGSDGAFGDRDLHPGQDVLAVGEDVSVSETVAGDAMAAGRRVVFDGIVGGSYVGAGGEQEVRGRVDGSIRAAGGAVRVEASVGRNVTAAGASVRIGPAAAIEHNAYLAGGNVSVQGSVSGHMYIGGGDVVLDGPVGGDVRVESGQLTLGPNARLAGDLRYRTEDGSATIDPRARIEGTTEVLPPRQEAGNPWVLYVLRVLAFLVTGVVAVALAPSTFGALAAETHERPAASLGLGLLGVLLVPLAILLTALSVVGLPLAVMASALYLASLYLAPVVPALWLGDTLGSRGKESGRSPRKEQTARFARGGPIVAIVMLLPFAGLVARLVVVSLGLGATVLLLRAADDEGALLRT